MSDNRSLHSWLFDKSEKEKEIQSRIDETIKSFEATEEYKSYREALDKLYSEYKEATKERLEEGKRHRPVREKSAERPRKTKEEREAMMKARYESLPQELKELIEKYNSLSGSYKGEFNFFIKNPERNMYGELDNYENPITTEKNIRELQDILVQDCIDYINENGLTDIDRVAFSVDGLEGSAPEGEWCSCSDSSIYVEGLQLPKDENYKWPVRKIIGENL